jgi:hypothetical protein
MNAGVSTAPRRVASVPRRARDPGSRAPGANVKGMRGTLAARARAGPAVEHGSDRAPLGALATTIGLASLWNRLDVTTPRGTGDWVVESV